MQVAGTMRTSQPRFDSQRCPNNSPPILGSASILATKVATTAVELTVIAQTLQAASGLHYSQTNWAADSNLCTVSVVTCS